MKSLACLFAIGVLSVTLLPAGPSPEVQSVVASLPQTEEHLRNIKQLTFGGENAEAYFSADGRKLIFQSTRDGRECDQIYTMNIDGSDVKMISNGDRANHVLLFLSKPEPSALLIDASGRNSLSSTSGFFQGLCVGHLSQLRHFHCSTEWLAESTTDQDAWLRCRGDNFNER